MFLPDRMRELRLQQNITQAMVAAQLHISREAYCQYENGKRRPSLDALSVICQFISASTDYLFDLSPVNVPYTHLTAQELYILSHLRVVSKDVLDLISLLIRDSLP